MNTVSESMTEAVNATCIDAPEEVSEWDVSGYGGGESSQEIGFSDWNHDCRYQAV